jgi:hypothetical protein
MESVEAFTEVVRRKGVTALCGYCGSRRRLSGQVIRQVIRAERGLIQEADICSRC